MNYLIAIVLIVGFICAEGWFREECVNLYRLGRFNDRELKRFIHLSAARITVSTVILLILIIILVHK